MPIEPNDLRRVMASFATGVTVITTHDGAGRDYGLTANALCSVSLAPPLLLVCIDKGAESYAAFGASGVFVVNVLTREQEEISRRFAKSGGDKFAGLAFRRGTTGGAVLDGALAFLECRVAAAHDAGDHTIYVGGVETAVAAAGDPLLFFGGAYGRFTAA
jgi:flavin reductase (DIM6/NTAB) family NADH-FMN oxidoreductase RutF